MPAEPLRPVEESSTQDDQISSSQQTQPDDAGPDRESYMSLGNGLGLGMLVRTSMFAARAPPSHTHTKKEKKFAMTLFLFIYFSF